MLILNMPKVSDNEVKVCSSNHRLQTALNIKGQILFQHSAQYEVREMAVSTSALLKKKIISVRVYKFIWRGDLNKYIYSYNLFDEYKSMGRT